MQTESSLLTRVSIIAAVALGACGSDDGAVALRAGVVTIYAGQRAEDLGCSASDPAQCPGYEGIVVADVDWGEICEPPANACGLRLAVLTMSPGFDDNPKIHVSDNGGVTWRTIVLFDANLESNFGWDSGALGVHVAHGEIYLLLSRSAVGAGGDTYSRLSSLHVDAQTGVLSEVPGQTSGGALPQHHHDRLRWMHQEYDFRDLSRWPAYIEFDPATGTVTDTRALTCSDGRVNGEPTLSCRSAATFASPNGGDYFDGYSLVQPATEVCRISYHAGDPDGHALCVPRHAWPGTDSSYLMPMAYVGAVPYAFWSAEGNVHAAAIVKADDGPDSGKVTDVIDLGPGPTPEFVTGRFGRSRWSRFTAIRPSTGDADRFNHDRLIELDADAKPSEVVFRDSPCSSDTCGYKGAPDYGYRLAQWITPFSTDEYLVFYVVQSESVANQQTLYVSREKPTKKPIVAVPPTPFVPGDERPPEGMPELLLMSPLERACIRLEGCGLTEPGGFQWCIQTWLRGTARVPAQAEARAAFVAAMSCEALAAFAKPEPDAHHCGTMCLLAGGECADGIDASDDGGTDVPTTATCSLLYQGPEPCNSCLSDGRFIECGFPQEGPEHYAVPCADFGLECATFVSDGYYINGCVPPAGPDSTCDAQPPTCEGNVWTQCEPGTQQRVTYDCGALNATCRPVWHDYACAEPPAERAACLYDPYGVPACIDQFRILTCTTNRPHYSDCRALGFQGCEAVRKAGVDGALGETVGKCW